MAEPVSRDQIPRREWGQGDVHFPCSTDHEQDWQPYPVDPYPAICDGHTIITYHSDVFQPKCQQRYLLFGDGEPNGLVAVERGKFEGISKYS